MFKKPDQIHDCVKEERNNTCLLHAMEKMKEKIPKVHKVS